MKRDSKRFSRKRSLRTSINSVRRKRRKTRGDFTHQTLKSPMLLRTSIYSTTKKFFQKTVENFKSFVSGGGYQRLPKSPSHNPIHHGVEINFDRSTCREKRLKEIKMISTPDQSRREIEVMISTPDQSRREIEVRDLGLENGQENGKYEGSRKEKKIVHRGKRRQDHSNSKIVSGKTRYLVEQKLKELEMMDKSNVDHVLDVEEVLRHYSRLTCPAYRDIVDKFFMDMYSELFIMQASSCTNNLRPRLRTMK